MSETNDFPKFFNHKKILDIVLMNEDPCLHSAKFWGFPDEKSILGTDKVLDAIPQPRWKYVPATENGEMEVEVKCPICNRKYEEASKRLFREICSYMERMSGATL